MDAIQKRAQPVTYAFWPTTSETELQEVCYELCKYYRPQLRFLREPLSQAHLITAVYLLERWMISGLQVPIPPNIISRAIKRGLNNFQVSERYSTYHKDMLELEKVYRERNKEDSERACKLPDHLQKDRRELKRLGIQIRPTSKSELERRCVDGRCSICLDAVEDDETPREQLRAMFEEAGATNSMGEYPAIVPDENWSATMSSQRGLIRNAYFSPCGRGEIFDDVMEALRDLEQAYYRLKYARAKALKEREKECGQAAKLCCGHAFGLPCITRWAIEFATCPVCRAKLRQTPLTPVRHQYTVEDLFGISGIMRPQEEDVQGRVPFAAILPPPDYFLRLLRSAKPPESIPTGEVLLRLRDMPPYQAKEEPKTQEAELGTDFRSLHWRFKLFCARISCWDIVKGRDEQKFRT